MAIRRLKYASRKDNFQHKVEQPYYTDKEGVKHKLKKWIHNNEIVWEDGGLASLLGAYSTGYILLDVSSDEQVFVLANNAPSITSGKYFTNEKIGICVSTGRYFALTKDLVSWTRCEIPYSSIDDVMYAVAPCEDGFVYILGSKKNYEMHHIIVNPDTLEFTNTVIWNSAKFGSFCRTGSTASSANLLYSGQVRLDGFFYGFDDSSAIRDVGFYKYRGASTLEFISYMQDMVKDNIHICYEGTSPRQYKDGFIYSRYLFSYNSTAYRQLIYVKVDEEGKYKGFEDITKKFNRTQMYTFGQFLDEKAYRSGQSAEDFAKRRAQIKNTILGNYSLTMGEVGEDIEFTQTVTLPFSGTGAPVDDIDSTYYVIGSDYISGFLNGHTNMEFRVYAYKSSTGKYELSTKKVNIYSNSKYQITGDDNYQVTMGDWYADSMGRQDENSDVKFDLSNFWIARFGNYVVFRHKTAGEKSFAINTSSARGGVWCGSDIPKEFFD